MSRGWSWKMGNLVLQSGDDLRGYEVRKYEVRNATGFAVHGPDGMLVFRCGSEAAAKAKIDKIISGEDRGTRPRTRVVG